MSVQLMVYNCSRAKCRWKDLPLGVVKLLAILCALRPPPLCEAAAVPVRYVKPIDLPDATCPSEPCYTLDEYVNNSTRYFVSNAVFMFLSGNHILSNSLNVSGMSNITLTPQTMSENAVWIYSNISTHVQHVNFTNCTNIMIAGLTTVDIAFLLHALSGTISLSHTRMTVLYDRFNGCFINTIQNHTSCKISLNSVSMDGLYMQVKGVCGTLWTAWKVTFEINNVNISRCEVGMKLFIHTDKKQPTDSAVSIKSARFQYNSLALLVSPALTRFAERLLTTLNITLDRVLFNKNEMGASIYKAKNVTIHNCTFSGHSDSAIIAMHSMLYWTGCVFFINNNGSKGGAVYLNGLSTIWFLHPKNTQVHFENNTATDRGGALYFSNEMIWTPRIDLNEHLLCPFVVKPVHQVLTFTNNRATNAGNAIYGIRIDGECLMPPINNTHFSLRKIDLIRNISNNLDHTEIATNDYSISVCKNHRHCTHAMNSPIDQICVYPGQLFNVSVTVFTMADSEKLSAVSMGVKAQVVSNGSKLGNELQTIQKVEAKQCTNLTYSLLLSNESINTVNLSLSVDTYDGNNYKHNLSIYLYCCPIGFSLDHKICKCNSLLNSISNSELKCNITNKTISRTGQTWIGTMKGSLAVSSFCQYCLKHRLWIAVEASEQFDIQCKNNHSGVLCGGCKRDFSLALGSDNCLSQEICTNNSIALIVAFMAAGIALVFFIKILNLTISHGTLNGLIFYANIVGANPVMFPITDAKPFLSVFIAWVNLDLGIETCFFDGMDAYVKAWLQFVFPVYVWAIALFIIVLSHYSMRASKLFGNNSVPVLATLILLSYSKLLRAVISALSVAEIRVENENKSVLVWERNGNIQYLTGKHIPLFVFALAVLLLLWFPFTLILVSIQWLQRGTHYRVLCWVTRLMPFFDAFTGPLKEKHRYWVGTLLLVRCILLTICFNVSTRSTALVSAISVICVVLAYLASVGYVYTKTHVALLELLYILNLGLLSALMLSVPGALALQVSIGIAFGQFVVTMIYLIYLRLAHMIKRLFARPMHHSSQQGADDVVWVERNSPASNFSHTSVETSDCEAQHLLPAAALGQKKTGSFRESLLEYMN